MASAGMEYVIEHVNEGKTGALNLRGYGIFPGSSIRPVFKSPAGDPVAYEIMGTVLALRLKDSEIYTFLLLFIGRENLRAT